MILGRLLVRRHGADGWNRYADPFKPMQNTSNTTHLLSGCGGPVAARLALLRAQRQLYTDADVHINLRNFNVHPNRQCASLATSCHAISSLPQVINQVGAAGLRATLNCEEFAKAHSSTSHYDVKSFVGLAWRPAGEAICCEVYSTGRSNLPGSTVERQLHESYMRMLPELLRYSSSSSLLSKISEDIQSVHRTDSVVEDKLIAPKAPLCAPTLLWEDWDDAKGEECDKHAYEDDYDDGEVDLSEMGL